jgi:prepilin-type N-terminal cleavage/methylation domain-containing protein
MGMARRGTSGFTLLEILVAMAILMVLVLMMSTLFHQSTIAWDSGLRQAEMSMQARAAMALMQRDLMQAVAGDVAGNMLECEFWGTGFGVCTLAEASGNRRAVKWVSYEGSGNQLIREEVPIQAVRPAGAVVAYGSDGPAANAPFLDNVSHFGISVPAGTYTTNLPPWVEISLTLEHTSAGAAGIRVWSNGRDREFDTEDDKDKRLRTWRD